MVEAHSPKLMQKSRLKVPLGVFLGSAVIDVSVVNRWNLLSGGEKHG
jgi:hypothetical protein